MLFHVAALALLSVPGVTSSNVRAEHRGLSLTQIAGYEPGSDVVDHAAIDLDQEVIEKYLGLGTEGGFDNAKLVYMNGGNSKSYAKITLKETLAADVMKGTEMSVKNGDVEILGKMLSDAAVGDTSISFQYKVDTGDGAKYCRVGSLGEYKDDTGCIPESGAVMIGDSVFDYEEKEELNKRNLQGFSTAAKEKMGDKKHDQYMKFYNYYGEYDYANQWVVAAFDKKETKFDNGNANFSVVGDTARTEAIKKGIVYMSVHMYVLREFEDAVADCEAGCTECNEDPVHAWDEGVAFYVGSTAGVEANNGENGKLVYALANKRCQNFGTCGEDGDLKETTSAVNRKLINLFTKGKNSLLEGKCTDVKPLVAEIANLMTVPMVQGTLRYAYKVDKQSGGEKENAEGAVFAAGVLPVVHACNDKDAEIIYDQMKLQEGTYMTDSAAVKKAFERQYECMGITCEMVGGLLNGDVYFDGAEPCSSDGAEPSSSDGAEPSSSVGSKSMVLALATSLGAFALAILS